MRGGESAARFIQYSQGLEEFRETLRAHATKKRAPLSSGAHDSRQGSGVQLPLLALFGELNDNILAEKNRAAWEAALTACGHRDYTLRILPTANNALEAKVGNNAEMKSLQRFVHAYSEVVLDWLSRRIKGLAGAKQQPVAY